jgi:hypothetical protein
VGEVNTYSDLEGWLTRTARKADMSAILGYLQDCVEDEMEVLLAEELRSQGRRRSSKKLVAQCRREAQEQYAEEIAEMIEGDVELSAWTVISYRRKPKAWAIAGAIKQRIEREKNA